MNRILWVGLAACLVMPTSLVWGYEVSVETVDTPYEVVVLGGDPERKHTILGELNNSPEMYEITSDAVFTLTVEIRAVPNAGSVPQFSGIIIRQKEQLGVEEVARLTAAEASWSVVSDGTTGLRYQSGPFFSQEVPAGTYRIEVSTPDNSGKYLLVVGDTENKTGYVATLGAIGMVYDFYGLGSLSMFSSPYIHYPVGILVLLLLILGTWYWQHRRA